VSDASGFRPSPRSPRRDTARDTTELFDAELEKIRDRLRSVEAAGRGHFRDGSDSYDHASIAVVRLAALLEGGGPFASHFASLDDEARRGIVTTRNIISHSGYARMDDDVFWRTVTVDIPDVLRAIGLDQE
jgi:hypothetical protein